MVGAYMIVLIGREDLDVPDTDARVAVAYTDMTIFGPLSRLLAAKVNAEPLQRDGVFAWRFPDPHPDVVAQLKEHNFIHGSSLYRRSAYERVGGYVKEVERPEDHSLFHRMLLAGYSAAHVPELLVEYRQHSRDQANTALNLQLELSFHRRELLRAREEILRLERELERAKTKR